MKIRVKLKQYIRKWKYDNLYSEDIVYNQKSFGQQMFTGLECAYFNLPLSETLPLLKFCCFQEMNNF